jgi:hypothetical protein
VRFVVDFFEVVDLCAVLCVVFFFAVGVDVEEDVECFVA